MSATHEPVSVEVAHKRFKTLVKLGVLAFVVSIALGGLGGWMILSGSGTNGVRGFVLLAPALICVVVTCIPIRILRNRWFESGEAILAASRREPWPPESGESVPSNERDKAESNRAA